MLFSTQSIVRSVCSAVVAAAFGIAAPQALAQAYPTKPVKIVIPFAPGGGADRVIRLISAEMEKTLGQPMVPEYKPGAVGLVGTAYAAKEPADGYTVVFTPAGVMTVLPHIEKDMQIDPLRDLAPVTLVYSSEVPVSAKADAPFNNLRDMIAYAKANPGKLTYGHSGNFGLPHIAMELLKQSTGADILAVPFRSEAPATMGLIAGETDLSTVTFASVGPHVKEGKAKILAQLGPRRAPQMPDIPTAVESGYPNVVVSSWIGAFVPTGTPKPVIDKLHGAMTAAMKLPAVRDGIIGLSFAPVGNTPEAFAAQLRTESAALKKVIDDQKLRELPR